MAFSEIEEFLSENPKYKLTKNTEEMFNNQCKTLGKGRYKVLTKGKT